MVRALTARYGTLAAVQSTVYLQSLDSLPCPHPVKPAWYLTPPALPVRAPACLCLISSLLDLLLPSSASTPRVVQPVHWSLSNASCPAHPTTTVLYCTVLYGLCTVPTYLPTYLRSYCPPCPPARLSARPVLHPRKSPSVPFQS